ncbi:meiotically up-regulated gene 113-domain-containing protein [Aspergillus karnatakaensis]|uniref:GIY-YIG nuclease family protein n=1 Tax=Aspergillus karnatakaensis TaxID=1810916 RepID=UPI003CCD2523
MTDIREAQVPPKQSTPRDEHDLSLVSCSSTPVLTPTSQEDLVFSPNESLLSDATDATDYGWDTPTPGTPCKQNELSSAPIPRILIRAPTVNDITSAISLASTSPTLSAAESSNTCLYSDDEDELNSASAAAETPSKSAERIEPLGLLQIFSTLDVSKGSTRRQSFSATPDYSFTAPGLAFKSRPRSLSTSALPVASHQGSSASSASESIIESEPHRQPGAETTPADATRETSTRSINVEELAREDLAFRESLANILPLSIQELLAEDDTRCIATTKKNERCKRRTPKGPAVLRALDKAQTSRTVNIEEIIKDIFESALCGSTHKKAAEGILSGKSNSSMNQSDRLLIMKQRLESITAGSKEVPTIKAERASSIVADDAGLTSTLPAITASITLPEPDPSPTPALPDFVPYISTVDNHLPVSERLRKILTTPLTPGDVSRQGLMYIYQCQGKFGHFKIGYTINVRARLQGWEKQCGRDLWCYFPLKDPDTTPVLHINRVEKLIHTELAAYRRQEMRCAAQTCGKKHIEWFEVGEEIATKVVKRWMEWMREGPYEPRKGSDGETRWVLRDAQLQKLDILCAVTEIVSASSALAKSTRLSRPKSRDGRGRRKSMLL